MVKNLLTLSFLLLFPIICLAEGNFVVRGNVHPVLKQRIVDACEHFRTQHAIKLTGKDYPKWSQPCPIIIKNGSQYRSGGGATSYKFDKGEVFDFQMEFLYANEKDLLNRIIPHEVHHAVTATYYREPLPRWADEGWCCYVEQGRPTYKHQYMIPFRTIMSLKDYPEDTLNFYAQSQAMVTWLISLKGEAAFRDFIHDYLKTVGDWPIYLKRHYGFDSYEEAQNAFMKVE